MAQTFLPVLPKGELNQTKDKFQGTGEGIIPLMDHGLGKNDKRNRNTQ